MELAKWSAKLFIQSEGVQKEGNHAKIQNLSTYKHLQWQYQYYKYPPVLGQWPGRSYSTGNAPLFLWQPRLQQQSISLAHEIPTSPTMHEIPRYLRPQDVLQEWGATRHENIDIPPKELVGLEKKKQHLHRTSCGWSPTSASWCMTSRGLSESTTSRKPGVRIGLRLPTLRTSTEKLSTRQRPYFNPPKCPANKSLNILSIGLGFFQTISSFPGSSFLNLDHGEEIEQLFQYLVLTTVFLYPQKSRAMQDSPAVGRWPWFVSFPLVYQAFAWPNQCRIHSFWMTIYI